MSWEGHGTVKLYGKSIPGSNIIDLVNYVIRHRKGSEPTASQAFVEGLRDINIPQDVIGQRERWEWMHHAPETPKMSFTGRLYDKYGKSDYTHMRASHMRNS